MICSFFLLIHLLINLIIKCCAADKMACLVKIFVWILLYFEKCDKVSGVEICPYVEECYTTGLY